MSIYRITKARYYDNPNCLAHVDLSARLGYYVQASSEDEALSIARDRWTEENGRFTCTLFS